MERSESQQKVIWAWALTALVGLLAVIAWGQTFGWNFASLDIYQVFPVLGLLAFSIMWSQYVVGALQKPLFQGVRLDDYYRLTGYAVLVAIVFHPGLLIFQRFHDGYGLPPGSYLSYVAPSMKWIALLGSVSLLVFLGFELHRWFGDKKWWQYFLVVVDLAVIAVFYHGLRLGSQLQGGWFHWLWLFYGAVLLAILLDKYLRKIRSRATKVRSDTRQ